MTPQEKAVEAFRSFAQEITGERVTVGLLPTEGGIAVQVVTGTREFTSLDLKNRRAVLSLDILSKMTRQEQAYGCLCAIANACDTAVLAAPVVNASARSEPSFVGKDGGGWIYSLSVGLRIMI